jgi:hypothetical protein
MSEASSITTTSFSIVTPSHAPDYERCRLLAESVQQNVVDAVHHYIVVDRRDEQLFSGLRSSRTHILTTEEVLPGGFFQVPFAKRWWINLRGAPVRGWIIQQIVKLSAPSYCDSDVFLFVDSDNFFVKPYDPRDSVRGDDVPLFREELQVAMEPFLSEWHRVAARLLGLDSPVARFDNVNFVGNVVTWRRANVAKLQELIERETGKKWVRSLTGQRTMSEYILYGDFCEQVLKDRSGHYYEPRIPTLNYWKTQALDDDGLRELHDRLGPDHVAVMVSAKSRTPVPAIRRAFGFA